MDLLGDGVPFTLVMRGPVVGDGVDFVTQGRIFVVFRLDTIHLRMDVTGERNPFSPGPSPKTQQTRTRQIEATATLSAHQACHQAFGSFGQNIAARPPFALEPNC
jgi:hypothetical protein